MEQISKRCPRCGETKLLAEFRSEPSRPRGVCTYCRACEPAIRREKYLARRDAHNAYARSYLKAHPEKRREYQRRHFLRKTYGISLADWERMYEEQEGRCLICQEIPDTTLHVDHCHDQGHVRGLLCTGCNSGIAYLRHDPVLLHRAIEYLTKEPAWK